MTHSEKLHRTFVRDEAYTLLRNWIVEGKLEPSQKLRDKDLAIELGVSRTPIREALLRLECEGLVQTKANSSTIVCPIDLHDAFNLYAIVITLEQLALRQAFNGINPTIIKQMQKINEQLLQAIKSNDPPLAAKLDDDFHAIYIQLSGNSELSQVLLGIKQKLKRLEIYYFDRIKDSHNSYQEHLYIIEALQKRDLELALESLEVNWRASFSRIAGNQID